MHIPDGILPATAAIAGYAAAGGLTWYSLRQIRKKYGDDVQAHIPKAALLTAAFFVGSLIHIPVPPASVHLILNGLLGVVLGWFAVPAILIGLLFQAIMFQHGGITTLGVNMTMFAIPALLAHGIFQLRHRFNKGDNPTWTGVFGFLAGGLGLGIAIVLAFTVLITTIDSNLDVAQEQAAITILSTAHVPLIFIEGILTAMLVVFLQKVRPEMLYQPDEATADDEAQSLEAVTEAS